MNFNSHIAPVWQLLVNQEGYIAGAAKYHCFVDDKALCGEKYQNTEQFDDGITWESATVLERPDFACKRCLKKWKKEYQVEV